MNKRSGLPLLALTVAATAALWACSKTPETTASLPAASSAAANVANVTDIDVTEHVKTALQRNDALKALDIQVATIKGDVRLSGVVDSQAQIDEAVRIARASDGAHSIHDELTIRK